MKPALLLLAWLCYACLLSAQTTWYVRAGASPTGADGESWATATPYLQDALEVAQHGDAVWVAEGVYKPSASNDRYATFILKNGVRLYGGFAGTETKPEQRDWALHPSVISGDIGVPGDSTDNSFGLLYAAKTDATTRVDGLVFEYGNAGNPDNVNVFAHERTHSGSAIYLYAQGAGNAASLTIANCVFRHNRSDYFGAVFANGRDNGLTNLRVENCRFLFNSAYHKGGALAVENYSDQQEPLVVSASVFEGNFTRNGGGAVYVEHHQDIRFFDCAFNRNLVFAGAGGAVSLFGTGLKNAVEFVGCSFFRNDLVNSLDGGAVDYYPFNAITALRFLNCSFAENKASEGGCVNILLGDDAKCPLRFEQCRFLKNQANVGSVLTNTLIGPLGGLTFTQCLFYQNTDNEIYMAGVQEDTARLQNSIIVKTGANGRFHQGGQPLLADHTLLNRPNCANLSTTAICGPGMLFNANPFFVQPDSGDFHLQPCSPAVNAGDNAAAIAAALYADLTGAPRILDGAVDLGPYEQSLGFEPTAIVPASCPGAYDGALSFGGALCPPVAISWVNGDEKGTRTDSLAPGTYLFTFIDGAGHSALDTIVIPSAAPPLVLSPNVAGPVCFGQTNGVAGVDVSGGNPPYQIAWPNGTTGAYLFNVAAGAYPVTVTDNSGCAVTQVIEVPSTPMMQVFYTVTPASGPTAADGQIQIDSVSGCAGVFLWPAPAQVNLSPGNYIVTVSDSCGCFLSLPVTVGFATATGEQGAAAPATAWLSPNPAVPGQTAVLRWTSKTVETVWVQDALGRIVWQTAVPPGNASADVPAPAAPGVYWITARGAGRGSALRWVVR